ncbi:nuclear RNA export factor 1-like [Clytia hemisphaerica]|uniref:Nuclear RNA export factor 1 n=1 Tax=Clytia hemisphaerica TaxID=252671 RepID=A0A7M5V9Z1_9CNID
MAGTFFKAMSDISVKVGSDGSRNVGNNAAMDREDKGGRGFQRNDNGGRWQRGGGFRGRGRGRGGRGGNRGGRGGNRGGSGNREYHPRSRFENDDDDQDGDASMGGNRSGRFNPYGGRGGGGGHRERDRSPTNSSEWWKVIIPNGSSHDREWLVKQLKKSSNVPFEEKNCHNVKESFCFFVNDESAAKALRRLNNTITTRDGKIGIVTKPSDPPRDMNGSSHRGRGRGSGNGRGFSRGGGFSQGGGGSTRPARNFGETETAPEKLEVLKEFLSTRYDHNAVKLDLTEIGSDKTLRTGDFDTRIWQPKLMNTILMLVNELCPNLKSLDISKNRLQRLNILANLSQKCPSLEELNLSHNSVKYLDELSKISDCKTITKLWFSDNPAKEQYENDDSGYVSAIRKHLPSIKELDGVILPPPITFDLVDDKKTLPTVHKSYSCNTEATSILKNFVEGFFKIYDSADTNNRQELLQAYHNDAVFSVTTHNTISNKQNSKGLNDYFNHSRNLVTLKSMEKKTSLVKNKKLSVVALLTELPATRHLLESLILDVCLVTNECLVFNLKGIFLEGKDLTPRSFTRSFVGVPESGAKFLLINDHLTVRQATEKEIASLENGITQSSSTGATVSPNLSAEQQEMLQRFSQQSGMKPKYSLDCLLSSNWDFQAAAAKFNELKQGGKLPPTAFGV